MVALLHINTTSRCNFATTFYTHTCAANIGNPHPITNLVGVEQKGVIKRLYILRGTVS
jgi:hypothetical protein